MKNLLMSFALVCAVIFTFGCSPTINYLGETYTPTTQVDLFFDEADIQKQYKVIGVMKNEGNDMEFNYLDDIKTEMIKKAKEQGGDAILFVGSYTEKVTEETSHTEVEEDKDIVTTTRPNTEKVVEAKVLKYL